MAPRSPVPSYAGPPTGVRHWVVVFAVALAVVTYIDRVSIASAAPSIMSDLHLTKVQMGAALSAFGWAYAAFEIPGGFLGDWMGPRRVLLRIVVWWSFFTAATGWAWNLVSLAVTRFLFGAGEAGCFPNLTKAFTTWLPERERVRAQGILWLSARWGGAFTPPLVALVMKYVGWRHSFEIFGCLGLVWAVAFWFWYRDNPMEHPDLNEAEKELIRRDARDPSGHKDVPWGALLTSRTVWGLCWQYFCVSYGWYFYITWLPTYLKEGRHLDMGSAALLNILPLFCGGLGNPAGAWIVARVARATGDMGRARRIMGYAGCTFASAFLVLSTWVENPVLAMVVIGLASFSNDIIMPSSWASVMDVGGNYAGTLAGAMNMWGNVGGALAPLANGYLLTWTDGNWNITFYVAAAVYLLGVVSWAITDPTRPLAEGRHA
jgi:MFS transporter, ACS family, glucarate transporter